MPGENPARRRANHCRAQALDAVLPAGAAVPAIPIAVLSDSIAGRLQWAMAPLPQILTNAAARCRQREETGSVLQEEPTR